ncbi:RagB/SusD family nutrient uptake outer membrane protein [Filimonas effusa]|uniref:RagB/SusD family nutrient uptake outer membrane protein n=1 Tax=Filimonas effusa TaxID=2508721 RepID=A0A4Q1DBC0_9BACT|nr:RagB/SusD family nutrient uptake outer membrane protein [Filimonas effusa]RXK86741.1 RagB/SusD family nutrient uptake outer membrane protein [Filimonas effusa]
MKRKYRNPFLLAVLLLTVFTACNKQLNTAPSNAVPEEILFRDINNLATIWEGTWASMMDDFYGGTYSNPGFKSIGLVSDVMGYDVAVITTKYAFPATYRFQQMHDKTQARVTAFWNQLYKIINNMNIIIAHVDDVAGSESAKKILKGQSLALRAHIYTTLASFYQFSYQKDPDAKAVPLYTVPAADTTQGNPRASLRQIYQQVITDLTQAKTLLTGYSRPAKYKIDLDVVNGLLARAYLNTGQWANAAASAGEVLKNYTLMSAADYSKGFNDVSNVEWVWGHPEIPSQSDGSYSFHFLDVSSSASGYYSFMADPYFMLLFNDADIRKSLFKWNGATGREGFLQYKKFTFRQDETADLVLMRSAEMYLIEAEGYARNNQFTEAATALNTLRVKRNAPAFQLNSNTQPLMVDSILIERRKELFGEGFALSDIIRNQLPVVRKPYEDADHNAIQVTVITPSGAEKQVASRSHEPLSLPANSPLFIFAIPQSEEENNPNLYK